MAQLKCFHVSLHLVQAVNIVYQLVGILFMTKYNNKTGFSFDVYVVCLFSFAQTATAQGVRTRILNIPHSLTQDMR